MKVQYDQAADALYITLAEDAQVSRTVQIDAGTLVDLDRFGNVRGIEVVRPGRTWPLDEILSRFSIAQADEQLLRELQSGPDSRPHAFAGRLQIA
jgi:uncharacterized protein YuzE